MPHEKLQRFRKRLKGRRRAKARSKRKRRERIAANEPEGTREKARATARQARKLGSEIIGGETTVEDGGRASRAKRAGARAVDVASSAAGDPDDDLFARDADGGMDDDLFAREAGGSDQNLFSTDFSDDLDDELYDRDDDNMDDLFG